MTNRAPICLAVLVAALAVGAAGLQDAPPPGMPEPTAPTEQHAWLKQLVGEWDVSSEMSMGPGAEPMRMRSTESVRSVGGLWTLGEGKADMGGQEFTSLMTLGYDPASGTFVGTWVDTMFPYLWRYTGRLDEARRVLTLETEGPSFEASGGTVPYRDVIEIVDADRRTLTSSVRKDDGTWEVKVRAEFTRRP